MPELPHVDLDKSVNRSDPLAIEGHVLTNQIHNKLTNQLHNKQDRTLANALAGGPQNVRFGVGKSSAIREYRFHVFDLDFAIPKRLGDEWGLAASPNIEVTFDISPTSHPFPYAILCESYDAGCRLGISISKVIKQVRKQWWLEKRTMRGNREANSLINWLNEDVRDPNTHEWG